MSHLDEQESTDPGWGNYLMTAWPMHGTE